MNNFIRAIAVLFCSLMSVSSWAAGDLYVSTSGSDSNPGTQSAPFRSIQKAANVATAGTTVHVAPGTYTENVVNTQNGTASARIRFVSDTKWGAKVVPAGSSDTIWWSKGAYVDVVGFEIDGTNGGSKVFMGLYLTGSNSSAQGNHVHHIAATSAACTGSGGSGLQGDSWYGGTNIDLIGNVVHNIGYASCAWIQGIYHTVPGKIKNNLVYAVGAYGIHLWHDANHIDVTNNTVFNCGYGMVVGGGDFVHTTGPADYVNVANNIIFDNGGGIDEEGQTGSHNTYTNNLVFKNASYDWRLLTSTHSGDVSADPQFVNYIRGGGGDYHLKSSSPAIDKGTSSRAPASDLDGAARPQGAGYDIGAYEYGGTAPSAPAPSPAGTPALGSSLASVDFGSVVLGSSSAVKVVVMTNTGTAPLSFTADFAISSGFSGSGDCSTSVALNPGATCTLNMKFTPSVVGVQSGSLVVRTNAADSPKTIPLSGMGISASAPAVSLSPASLNFGSLTVGSSSSVQFITVTNTGNAILNFNGDFVLAGSDFAFGNLGTCATSLAPAASCTASLVFKPGVIGVRTGTLTINDNAAGSPHIVQLSGTGQSVAPVASVSASPTSLSFGRVRVGRSSSVKYVTITNTGKSIVTFSSAAVSGDFVFANLGTCGSSLAVGAKCTFGAKFVPKATGYRSGAITISTNASSTPLKVPLSGNGY